LIPKADLIAEGVGYAFFVSVISSVFHILTENATAYILYVFLLQINL
jgi:hypothetical protein